VVFPEYNGLQLLGMLPGVMELTSRAEQGGGGKNAPAGPAQGHSVLDVFRFAAPFIERTTLSIFSSLASRCGLYIMAGSLVCLDNGSVVNRAFLFDPAGAPIGFQDKVHLFPTEQEWGFRRGSRFDVFPTAIGTLAMPVCMDATYFETFRILSLMGARIALVPIANAEPYNEHLALRGIWPRVQESLIFGIKSALVGRLLEFEFTGRAGLFAPLELTPRGDGVLAETNQHSETELVLADLYLEALEELRRGHPVMGDMNPPLYRRYFPRVYESAPLPAHHPPGNAGKPEDRSG